MVMVIDTTDFHILGMFELLERDLEENDGNQ
jgi:hypothetical protein